MADLGRARRLGCCVAPRTAERSRRVGCDVRRAYWRIVREARM